MIDATIAYYDPPGRPPRDARPDLTSLPLAGKPVQVESMRESPEGFGLDRQGFTLVRAPTAVRDFFDRDEVLRTYVRETSELVRAVTGCTATAMMNAPLIRVSDAASQRPDGAAPTGDFVHADLSSASAGYLLRRSLPPGEADERLTRRYSLFNVWRTFSGPPQDVPLALCDTRTVGPDDKQYCTVSLQTSTGDLMTWENITYYRSPRHRWYYCPDMGADEAFVFRSFDSDPARAEQVPHSAFRDTTCPRTAPPRASVEVRMFAFYD